MEGADETTELWRNQNEPLQINSAMLAQWIGFFSCDSCELKWLPADQGRAVPKVRWMGNQILPM